MRWDIMSLELIREEDVVLARQQAREIALLLGFESQDQSRLAAAVSEIARNAYVFAGGGLVKFFLEDKPSSQELIICIQDKGPGLADVKAILEGRCLSKEKKSRGEGKGILNAQRLMDSFRIDSAPGQGTTVFLGKLLPKGAPRLANREVERIKEEISRKVLKNPWLEVKHQNRELVEMLGDLQKHQEELVAVNMELENTNRGVLALYTELDEKNQQLQKAHDLKSRFISNMSHEFRTPLISILNLSKFLLERLDGDLTSEQEKQVSFIKKAAEDLLNMVNDLLDMAKIEAGKINVQNKEFTVEMIFDTLRGIMRPLVFSPAVSLVFEKPKGIPRLYTDENKVSQIMRNLISNALKFTLEGQVQVSASLNPEGTAIVFTVADTGIGIAPEDQERIFEEYIQVKSDLPQQFKGTGLGLPLSRRLARLLGGDLILAKSSPGHGATFAAVIPLVYGQEAESLPVEKSFPQKGKTTGSILIIDDNETDSYAFRKLLKDTRFSLVEARSGQEGLKKAKEEKPQLIFLDLIMPGMSGFEVLKELKKDPAISTIPVIIYSSKVLEEEERNYLSREAAAIVSRGSLSREEIMALIKKILTSTAIHKSATPS